MAENTKTIKEICKEYGLGQTALSRRFGIPLRTVQDWYSERSNPPEYVVNMIANLLEQDEKNEKSGIEELLDIRKQLINRKEEQDAAYVKTGKNEYCIRSMELIEVIDIVRKRCEEVSPCDCDW